jgi:hypothetical protein
MMEFSGFDLFAVFEAFLIVASFVVALTPTDADNGVLDRIKNVYRTITKRKV